MPSKKRKLFNEIFNAAMSALVLFPALVAIQKLLLPEAKTWLGVLWMLPVAICYPVGRFVRGRERQTALSICFVAAALCALPASIAFAGSISVMSVIFLFLLCLGCGVVMFIIPYIAGSNLASGKYFVAGLALYVVALALGGDAGYSVALNSCAVVLLISGLFVFNLEGLRSATAPSGGKARFPRGMRRNNLIIIGIFVVLALLLANIKAIKDAAVAAGVWVTDKFIGFLQFMGDVNGVPEGDGAIGGGGDMGVGGLTADPHIASGLENLLWKILLYIIVGGIILAICFVLYKLIRKLLKTNFGALLDKLLGRLSPSTEDYVDETEDIDGEREKGAGLFSRMRARFTRRAKFGDMPTDRAKVRFAMREFLRKDRQALRPRTPNELSKDLEKAAGSYGTDFVEIYNRVRYSGAEPSSADVETARKLSDRA